MRVLGIATALAFIAFAILVATRIVLPLSVQGTSMLPAYRPGDLVLALRAGVPAIGDVVAYRDPDTDAILIHRVVDTTPDGRLVLKGDNNDFLDSYHPLPTEVMGTAIFRVPQAGRIVMALRSPPILAAAGMAILGLNLIASPQRRRRPQALAPGQVHLLPGTAAVALAIICLGGALAGWTFMLPAHIPEPAPISYRHAGEWRYDAPTPGAAWDAGVAHTGDPLFWKLNDRVNFAFDYSLSSDAPIQSTGRARLVATLSAPAYGWRRTFEMMPWQGIRGPTASLYGTLSLHDLWALQEAIRAQTGLPASSLLLEVSAEVETTISYGNISISDRFTPSLPFQADSYALRPVLQTSPSGPSTLTPSRSASLPNIVTRTNRLPGPLSIPVPLARLAGLTGVSIGIAIALACLLTILRLDSWSRSLLTIPNAAPVETLPPQMPRIAIASRQHLAALAQRLQLPVLVARTGELAVPFEGVLLVWSPRPGDEEQPSPGDGAAHISSRWLPLLRTQTNRYVSRERS